MVSGSIFQVFADLMVQKQIARRDHQRMMKLIDNDHIRQCFPSVVRMTNLEQPLCREKVHADVRPVVHQCPVGSLRIRRGGDGGIQLRVLEHSQSLAATCKHPDL